MKAQQSLASTLAKEKKWWNFFISQKDVSGKTLKPNHERFTWEFKKLQLLVFTTWNNDVSLQGSDSSLEATKSDCRCADSKWDIKFLTYVHCFHMLHLTGMHDIQWEFMFSKAELRNNTTFQRYYSETFYLIKIIMLLYSYFRNWFVRICRNKACINRILESYANVPVYLNNGC